MYFFAKPTRIRILLWTSLILWMVLIFCLSAQEADQSASLSGSTIRTVVEFGQPGFTELPVAEQDSIVESYQHAARKSAHVLAYLILGVLSMAALFQYQLRSGWRFASAFAVCAGYAGTDEIHQIFVAGRSGQITDVCIDSAGALAGIGIVILVRQMLVIRRKRRVKRRVKRRDKKRI